MKSKKKSRVDSSTAAVPPQSCPPPHYSFVPPPIPFYPPPPPHHWAGFPGAWPVPGGAPPPGFAMAVPPSSNAVAVPVSNVGHGKVQGGPMPPPPPPFGLWAAPPGLFPTTPMVMGPVMAPVSAQGAILLAATSGQGAVVPTQTNAQGLQDDALQNEEVKPVPSVTRRPVTRRSAALDRAACESKQTDVASLITSNGSQGRRWKSKKLNDAEVKTTSSQDASEANVVEQPSSPNEGVSTVESSEGEDNASLPKLGSEPYTGLSFRSEEAAYEFYNAYAKEKGFSIRKSHIQRSRVDRSVISREYVCANQGFRSTNDRRYKGKVVQPRRETRVDCRAAMSIKRRSKKWVVDRFHREHNHALVDPAKTEKLRSHRKITGTTKLVIDALYKCRIGPSKIIQVLTKAASSGDKVEIGGLDLMKYMNKERKNSIEVEGYRVLEYIQGIRAFDPGFFHAVEVGENRSMRSIFWADSRAREAYKQFGDALVFDKICRANKELFPFASFTGLNHHRQPVLFGCAVLADETVESLVWLFKTFLRAMSYQHPISMVTVQDKAVFSATMEVFPQTKHQFCMLEIEKNVIANLSELFNMHPDFQEEYKKCIYSSLKPEEFESCWRALLIKYHLKDSSWLNSMYDQRSHWVPLYLRDTFFAGMTSTKLGQAYFDGFLHDATPLNEFVPRYEQAVKRRRKEEADEDIMTIYTSAGSTSRNPIEEHAARVYTRNMFTRFGHEIYRISGCIVQKISEEKFMSKYLVGKDGDKADQMHIVTFDSKDICANCSCQMFEFEGMLCRHVLKVFQEANILDIPPRYILKRWTMSARYAGCCSGDGGGLSQDETTVNVCFLKEMAVRFLESGVSSTERNNVAIDIIEEGMKKFSLFKVCSSADEVPPQDWNCGNLQEILVKDKVFNDPLPITAKCSPPSKMKLGVKHCQKKKRKCSTCKKAGHYSSTCPKGSSN
ncbi:hypothetical protein Sjap_021561 [Stephania japonica]|uniref:Protein FAR1-RELATED SEQUENCE n=1 Tax=Stephania japonica TaxID=461633 RepID=A0AAP0EML4_9MAGN